MLNFRSSNWLTGLAFCLMAQPGFALTLDFSEFDHGDVVTSSQGVGITTTNIGGGPDLGVAFDTNLSGTRDRDLERGTGFSVGNLSGGTDLGLAIIIQENSQNCHTGTCSLPDDEGSRPAGSIDLDYSSLGTFDSLSVDLIDVESVTAENGSVEFFLGGTEVASIGFNDFLSDPSVVYGDNSANRIVDVVAGVDFDRVVFHLGGSGAIDNVTVTAANPVPEPSAALLFGMGALVAGSRVRRD